MLAQVPQLDVKQAVLRTVPPGHVALGLGSLDYSLPVGDIAVPGLNNLKFHIPSLTAQNLSVIANPVVSSRDNSRTWRRRSWRKAARPTAKSSRRCESLALEVTTSARKNYSDAIPRRLDVRQYSVSFGCF